MVRFIKDWLQLPGTLFMVWRIHNSEAIKYAVALSQAIHKENKKLPYWIAINALRSKYRRYRGAFKDNGLI